MFFRNTHGSISCNTFSVKYGGTKSDNTGYLKDGYGGLTGKGSPGCPDAYATIGKLCIAIPSGGGAQNAASYDEMQPICKEEYGEDSVPYIPMDNVQNEVFAGYLSTQTVRFRSCIN